MKRERGTSWPNWQEVVLRHDHGDLRSTLARVGVDEDFYQLQRHRVMSGMEYDVTPLGLAIRKCCSGCIYAFVDAGVDFNRICFKDGMTTHTPLSLSLDGGANYTTRAVLRGGVDHLADYEEHIKRTLTGTDIPLIVERYRALRALMWTAHNLPDRIWRDIAEPMLKALDTAMRWKDMN